jgi:hypothetical protein
MRNPQGYAVITAPDEIVEHDTITCGHCNKIVRVKAGTGATVYIIPTFNGPPKEEAGAFCRQCMRAICLPCCDIGVCTPLMKRIEAMEDKGRRLKAMGVA